MIVLENIGYAYRKRHEILSHLNLSIQSGSICGLLGRNGVGKSTILYLIAGLLKPLTGTVRCNGYDPFERKTDFLRDIYIVPEEFMTPTLTLREYASINAPFYPRFSVELFEKLLSIFELDADCRLNTLSMGMKKKAILTFGMSTNTSILLLDEPTNGLDISAKMAFRVALSLCMDENKTILISTHQVHDVEQLLDHIAIIDGNGVRLDEDMADISSRLRFGVTNDPDRINRSLYSIQVPGGRAVVESLGEDSDETEVNLECLFEMVDKRPDIIESVFADKYKEVKA